MESLVGPQVDEMDFEPEHKTFADFGLDERILKVFFCKFRLKILEFSCRASENSAGKRQLKSKSL